MELDGFKNKLVSIASYKAKHGLKPGIENQELLTLFGKLVIIHPDQGIEI